MIVDWPIVFFSGLKHTFIWALMTFIDMFLFSDGRTNVWADERMGAQADGSVDRIQCNCPAPPISWDGGGWFSQVALAIDSVFLQTPVCKNVRTCVRVWRVFH